MRTESVQLNWKDRSFYWVGVGVSSKCWGNMAKRITITDAWLEWGQSTEPCVYSHHFEIVTESTLRLSYIFVFIQPNGWGTELRGADQKRAKLSAHTDERGEREMSHETALHIWSIYWIYNLYGAQMLETVRLCWPHRKEKVTICYKSSSAASRVRLQPHSHTTAFSYGGLATSIHSHTHNLMLHSKHKSNSIFMFY